MLIRLMAPWISIVALSGLAAFAIDQALVNASAPLPGTEPAESALQATAPRIVPTSEPATRWMRVTAVDSQGVRTTMLCNPPPGLFAAEDALILEQADLDRLATQMRCEPR